VRLSPPRFRGCPPIEEKVAAATLLAATFDLSARLEPEMELAVTLEMAALEMMTAFEIPATV